MAITYEVRITNNTHTRTVTCKDGVSVENYITGCVGTMTCREIVDGEQVEAVTNTVYLDASDPATKNSSDITAFSSLTSIPASLTASAEAKLNDATMREKLLAQLNFKKGKDAEEESKWADGKVT